METNCRERKGGKEEERERGGGGERREREREGGRHADRSEETVELVFSVSQTATTDTVHTLSIHNYTLCTCTVRERTNVWVLQHSAYPCLPLKFLKI